MPLPPDPPPEPEPGLQHDQGPLTRAPSGRVDLEPFRRRLSRTSS